MTTCASDIDPNFKRKRKRKQVLSATFRPQILKADLDLFVDLVMEGIGGKDYLAALFANNVLSERVGKKKKSGSVYKGAGKYDSHLHKIKKLGNGNYKVEKV